jgi:hypothetical protein
MDAELQMYSRTPSGRSAAVARRPASADTGPADAGLPAAPGNPAEASDLQGVGEDLWVDALQADDIDLILTEDGIGTDENGFFISGTVLNTSAHAFDAVRITFDLCGRSGEPYADVTDASNARMEPGDVWGFTIYIPYMNMEKFSSYRLQSIMGVTN